MSAAGSLWVYSRSVLLFVLKCEADLSIFLSLISPPIVYSKINSSNVETFGHISVAI